MTTREMSMLDCSPIFEKLKEYKACPTPPGIAWAHDNWHDPETVVNRIVTLAKEQKWRAGKGKALVCAVLGAALTAAQKERHLARQEEGETARSLQDQLTAEREKSESLQKQLECLQKQLESSQKQLTVERNATERACAALADALDREKILRSELEENERGVYNQTDCDSIPDSEPGFSSLAKLAEKSVSNSRPLYPLKELEISQEIFYPEAEKEQAILRPLIKTETTEGQGGEAPQVTTRTVPYSATELTKIQEKYTRRAQESETEYVWRVSLSGGDRVLLSEDEAQGYWGPGVFLTTDDQREPWSLTQRAAYWAGGLDPLERGDPACIETPDINHLTESLQKAACLQLMHDRRLVPQQPSPMLLNAHPDRMTPLIRGLPDSLKLYAVQLQDRLRNILAPRGGGRRNQRGGGTMTWGEVAQELINYGRRIGLTGRAIKSRTAVRRVEQRENRPPPQASGARRNLLWAEGIEKGIPRELMDGMPTITLEKLVRAWKNKQKVPLQTDQHTRESMRVEPRSNDIAGVNSKVPNTPEKDLIDLGTGNWTRRPQ
ncbi:uncharacterized protein LJ206_005158 isoform 1-T2 [Theristicus caerulescens]